MITPPNRGWSGTSFVCTGAGTSLHGAPGCVAAAARPSTGSRVAPLSHAVKVNRPEIGATLFEYGPFFTCDSSPSRSSPNAWRIGAALSGNGNGPGRIWMTGPPPVTRIACTLSAAGAGDPPSAVVPYSTAPGAPALPEPATVRWVSMPSFLCESFPTGQYSSYVPGLRVSASVAVAPGSMSGVSRSMRSPSTSSAWGMLPALVMGNVPGPATIVASESSTFHSDSLALTTAGALGARCRGGVAASATAASRAPATLRYGTACLCIIGDLPPARVGQQRCSMPLTPRGPRLFPGE